jgi:hypothetical protein
MVTDRVIGAMPKFQSFPGGLLKLNVQDSNTPR